MPPRITDQVTWQQAELLMQPAFIRVVDNLRKQLDESAWKGTYQDVLIWPANTTDEIKALVTQLLEEMETATLERADAIRETLASLPMPHPGYHLCLQRQDQQISIDLWELCYQVCFINYSPESETVNIDPSLIDELGEVDWQQLEEKTKELVGQVFANLPK
jgi:predicted metal-dependent phosphoesterase TrpH